jgi:hypothetical protein
MMGLIFAVPLPRVLRGVSALEEKRKEKKGKGAQKVASKTWKGS